MRVRSGTNIPREAPGPSRAPARAEVDLGVERARVIASALSEDLGSGADITSHATVRREVHASAEVVAREAGVIACIRALDETFAQLDSAIRVRHLLGDGQLVKPGEVIATVDGPLLGILAGERTALNLLSHLSGVATSTWLCVDALRGIDCKVRDTRKTMPGLRALAKAAVVVGGGENHRFGLWDALLVKDNHVAAAGGVGPATSAAIAAADGRPVQIEVTNVVELREALDAGAKDILLDNFELADLRTAVKVNDGRAVLEASGNITLDNIRQVAATGVDRVAMGWLTHSSPALDIGLDVVSTREPG